METKRLYRSSTNVQIGGVCGGIAEYFDIDPILVRVLFILVALYGGAGVLVYIILWIVLPRNPVINFQTFSSAPPPAEGTAPEQPADTDHPENRQSDPMAAYQQKRANGGLIAGIILIALGLLFLLDEFVPRLNFGQLWPVILIVIGVAILVGNFSKPKKPGHGI